MDSEGSLYITDDTNQRSETLSKGQTSGILVAGGNGKGDGLHQFNCPTDVFVEPRSFCLRSRSG